MQDLQCIDTLVNYFETESDIRVRQLIFDLIFSDIIYNPNELTFKNNLLTTFISYGISLQSKQTLDCLTQWLQLNLSSTNEELLTNNLFSIIIDDHFLFQNNTSLDSLAQQTPSFTSIFILITLNTIVKTSLKLKNLIISNFLKVLNSCLKINYQLPILIYTQNILSTTNINPFHGILYLTILYPLDLYQDSSIGESEKSCLYEIIENLHLICLKLIQELLNMDKTKLANRNEQAIKILSLNHAFFIENFFNNYLKVNENNLNLVLFNESLDKLAQVLQICLFKDALQFSKFDIKNMFEKYAKLLNNELFMLLF